MVYCTENYLVFWTFSIVWYSRKQKTRRFGNWICFRPQVKGARRHLLSWAPLKELISKAIKSNLTWRTVVNIQINHVGCEVLTPVVMKSSIFWDTSPCSPVDVKWLLLVARYVSHPGFLRDLFFYAEDGGDKFVRNVSWPSTDYTALYPR
jgi:hypothetical protein